MAVLNPAEMKAAALWRQNELPKERERAIRRGLVTREQIVDEIVDGATIRGLLNDPHEVWRPLPFWSYHDGYGRMEFMDA